VRPGPGQKLKVEARLRVAAGGPGYWSAFWMLGAPFRPGHTDWPGAGEIDVMENLGSQPATVHGTLHCGIFDGGPCRETTGLGGSTALEEGLGKGFHTYALEWDRSAAGEQLHWSVDGERYRTVRSGDVDPATWSRALGHGFFVLLNVAVGGGWPGPPDASTTPGVPMLVDRVAVSRATL
jgi:beta-glucanase (GH16 family)